MMVQQITSATEKVASLVSNGVEINQAVVQAAGSLPREAIKRVAENINVHNCLALFKSGEDRTKEFPLADPNVIFEQLGSEHVKTAYLVTKRSNIPGNSFYMKDVAPDNRKGHGYSACNFLTKEAKTSNAIRKHDLLQKKAEIITTMASKLGDIAMISFNKIASPVKDHPQATKVLISALHDKYGDKAAGSLVFLAKHAGLERIEDFSVDHTRFSDYGLFKHACIFVESMGGLEKLGAWEPDVQAEIDLMEAPLAEEEKWDKNKWKREREKYRQEKAKGGKELYKSVMSDVGDVNLGGLASAIARPFGAIFQGALKARGGQLPKYGDVEKPDVSDNAILALKYKQNFEDLIANDEILKEKDPKELANYFQTMIRMAPHLAADREILRAHLRQVSGQALMGPYDAKVLADLEESLHPTKRKK